MVQILIIIILIIIMTTRRPGHIQHKYSETILT